MIALLRRLLLVVHFAGASLTCLLICLCRPFHPTNSRWCAQIYASLGLPIIGLRVEAEGLEHFKQPGSYVVICNHQSNWDLFVVGSIVPPRTVSVGKQVLKWFPVFGQLYWLAGNILIDRSNHQRAMAAMETTRRALLERRTNIWFFPEGTRNKGNNLLPFRKGAFVTAVRAGVPIVPVACGPYLEVLDLNRAGSETVGIRVLPPIPTEGLTDQDVPALMARCEALIGQSVARARSG